MRFKWSCLRKSFLSNQGLDSFCRDAPAVMHGSDSDILVNFQDLYPADLCCRCHVCLWQTALTLGSGDIDRLYKLRYQQGESENKTLTVEM